MLGVPDLGVPPTSSAGRTFDLEVHHVGQHRVLHGDSLNPEHVEVLFGEDQAVCVLSDSLWELPEAFEPYVTGPRLMRYMFVRPGPGQWIASLMPELRAAINRLTEPGDIVADPYLGWGTTLLACEQTGRRCYGLEIEADRVAVSVARLGV